MALNINNNNWLNPVGADWIFRVFFPQEEIVDYINNGLPLIRKNIKKIEGKGKHPKNDYTKIWKKFISEFVADYFNLLAYSSIQH